MSVPGLPSGFEWSDLPLGTGPDGKPHIPRFDEAEEALTPIVDRCVQALAEAQPAMSDDVAFGFYVQCVDMAKQVAERGAIVDAEAFAAKMDIPAIDLTLPILAKGYEQGLTLWGASRYLMFTMLSLFYLGMQRYLNVRGGTVPSIQLPD